MRSKRLRLTRMVRADAAFLVPLIARQLCLSSLPCADLYALGAAATGELKIGDLTSAFRALVTETVDNANRELSSHLSALLGDDVHLVLALKAKAKHSHNFGDVPCVTNDLHASAAPRPHHHHPLRAPVKDMDSGQALLDNLIARISKVESAMDAQQQQCRMGSCCLRVA